MASLARVSGHTQLRQWFAVRTFLPDTGTVKGNERRTQALGKERGMEVR